MTTEQPIFYYKNIYPSSIVKRFDKTLDFLVQETHKDLSEKSGWKYSPLRQGSFGYDNIACSIIEASKTNMNDVDIVANTIHEGWTKNYISWRDFKPYENNTYYNKPYSPLGDERRNSLAITKFCDLPQLEKDKDIIIAKFLLSILPKF